MKCIYMMNNDFPDFKALITKIDAKKDEAGIFLIS